MISEKELVEMGRHWTPPGGLHRSRPRPVRLTAAGRGLLLLSILLLLGSPILGSFLGWMRVRQAEEARLLEAEGAVAEGVVQRLWRAGDKGKKTWISYRFGNGSFILEQRIQVPLSLWRRLHAGDRIPVRYVPGRPEINLPRETRWEVMPEPIPFLASAVLLAGGFLPLAAIRQQKKLLEDGRTAPARVLRLEKVAGRSQKQGMKYFFEFPVLCGTLVQGSAGPVEKPPAAGSLITVLYDAETPGKNRPFPFSLVTTSEP